MATTLRGRLVLATPMLSVIGFLVVFVIGGPIVGGVIGAIVYDLFIHTVLVDRGVPEAAGVEAVGRVVTEGAERV